EPRLGGDVYNLDYYVDNAKALVEMGADTICIKDMAGLISPYDAYNLIKALKEAVDIPIHLHTHFTSGMGDLALFKAIEAGVDIIDTCMAPYAYRTSHPAIEPLVVSLLGSNRDTGFNIEKIAELDKEIENHIPKYKHFLDTTRLSVIDINVILHQTPGGMLSNLVNQLRQMGELHRLHDVFEELPRVRKDLGQVPLVTPTSQIVGIQTVNNVLFDKGGERYTKITEQVKALCFGLYGKTPKPINPDVLKKVLKDYERGNTPITCRPGEILEPELDKVKEEVKDLAKNLDDVLICALFPVTGKRFLKWKYGLEEIPPEVKPKTLEDVEKENELIEKALAGKLMEKPVKDVPAKPEHIRAFDVFVDGEYYKVEVNEQGDTGMHFTPQPQISHAPTKKSAPVQAKAPQKAAATVADGDTPITAPMPGMIIEYQKKVGDAVKTGDTILVMEAMKMNNNIDAPCDGVIKEILHEAGASVAKGDILVVIG
ncbi:MAG: pyruvate carboxylase subunit B, partial [Candidatus Pacearchaeota archaeon]|nr:pyruvate carboxylase subunit B [Candidatus Pacearchaeota archaeon]